MKKYKVELNKEQLEFLVRATKVKIMGELESCDNYPSLFDIKSNINILEELFNFKEFTRADETLKIIHSWCVGNMETKGADDVKSFCYQVRELIEKTGIIK